MVLNLSAVKTFMIIRIDTSLTEEDVDDRGKIYMANKKINSIFLQEENEHK